MGETPKSNQVGPPADPQETASAVVLAAAQQVIEAANHVMALLKTAGPNPYTTFRPNPQKKIMSANGQQDMILTHIAIPVDRLELLKTGLDALEVACKPETEPN